MKQGPERVVSAGFRLRAVLVILAGIVFAAAGPALADAPSGPPAGTEKVPLDIRDLVEAEIAPHLVLPETAKWDFEFMAPYITGGKVVCGRVDYQSAMRRYVGPKRFYAIIKHGAVSVSQLQDPPFLDSTGAEARDFALLCDRK